MYYLLILIFIILLFYFLLKYNKHEFWDAQPVSHYNQIYKEGIITQYPKYDTKLAKNFYWNIIKSSSSFNNFLMNHYRKDEIYSDSYLEWILEYPNSINISLYSNNKIIGTIIGRPISLSINNKILKSLYVDYLCVAKRYRKQRLATKLINKIIENMVKNNCQICIFKIDNKKLPFRYIGEYKYYYYNLKKQKYSIQKKNIEKLGKENIEEVYKYFSRYIKKYKLYQNFTINEFEYNFMPTNHLINSYITRDTNNNIDSFINLIHMNYKLKDKIIKSVEITYFIYKDVKVINEYLNYYKNFDYLIFLDIMDNNQLVKLLDVEEGHKVFYQLFNYNTNIDANEIGWV